jgi:hypothetical protein
MPEESDDVEEHDTERITPRTVANNTWHEIRYHGTGFNNIMNYRLYIQADGCMDETIGRNSGDLNRSCLSFDVWMQVIGWHRGLYRMCLMIHMYRFLLGHGLAMLTTWIDSSFPTDLSTLFTGLLSSLDVNDDAISYRAHVWTIQGRWSYFGSHFVSFTNAWYRTDREDARLY